jgi:4-cresol dehydrogenase (hydroxylating)
MAQLDDAPTRPLPPGVSEADFDRAIARLTEALGTEKVLTGEASLREFRDPFQHAASDAYTASAVVLPTTVEEVQAIVAVANETGVPLWTHGQGKNNGYGGPAPRVSGSVVVSLRNMNKVLEIDEELGYAVVEPGVRWFDLYEAVRDGGHDLMVSIPDIGWGSVVGNTLDHGVTYLPYGVDMQSQCGMEVVLANGDVMRTGMGAMEGNRAWHCYKRGLGPTPDQLFMQSNFGIVTKMGYWLMPMPEVYMPLFLRVWNDDDLGPAMDVLRRLMLDGTIRQVPTIGNTLGAASMFANRADWWQGEGPIPEDVLDRMARELEVGRWVMRLGLYGDEAVVDHGYAKVKEAFESAIPGCDLVGTKRSPKEAATLENPHEQILGGVPNLDVNHMTGWYGGEEGGHIGFSPMSPLTGKDALAVRDLMRGMIEAEGLDYIAGILCVNGRSFAHITMLIFDTKNEEQTATAYRLASKLVVEAGKLGYGEYRAHLDFMDLAAEQYGFGDHAQRRFNERIKDALDPNGILSPGKSGIWPARLRS